MVVPKLVFILSRWACNIIYWNSNKAYVLCSALPFQQAFADIRVSNKYQVTAGFVKTFACTPPKKERKNELKQKFIHFYHPHFSRLYI